MNSAINYQYEIKLTFLAIFICLFCSCSSPNKTEEAKDEISTVSKPTIDPNVVELYVYRENKFKVNGKPSSIEELDVLFKKLKENNGTVHYSRDDIQSDPPDIFMDIVDLVTKYELPIAFYTDSTFTKSVGF